MENKIKIRPLSLRNKLALLIVVAYVVPILSMVSLLQQFIEEQVGQQNMDVVEVGLRETTGLAVTYLESMLSASRQLTYDGGVDAAYARYLEWENPEELSQWTESSLSTTYRYNSLFLSAGLFFHDNSLPSHYVSNDISVTVEELEAHYETMREDMKGLSEELDSYIGFYSKDNQLFLLRNLLTPDFEEYALLVLEVNIARILGAFQGITGVYSIQIFFDEALVETETLTATPRNMMDYMEISHERTVERHKIKVILGVDHNQGREALDKLTQQIVQIWTLIIPTLGYMLYSMSRHITKPLGVLLEAQRRVEQGELGFQVEKQPTSLEFEALTLGFNAMSYSMKEQFQRSYQEQLALQDARMKTLQSQINPHFLNNTLEIINWETRMAGNSNASAMIEALSVMLGATMDREGKGKIPFSEELTYVDAYLYIQSRRIGARLTVEQEIDPATLGCMVPRLAFQPIVENAFEHGIATQKQGKVRISTYFMEGYLVLEVKNSGSMAEEEQKRIDSLLEWDFDAQTYRLDSPSLGVRNVNQRVKMMYGQEYGLDLFNDPEGNTVARLILPWEEKEKGKTE